MSAQIINGTYRIERQIGEGSMGTVFEVTHLETRRRLALKLLGAAQLASSETVARFHREARITGELGHPNIVRLADFDSWDGQPYLVMELLEGLDLGEALARQGQLDPARAIQILEQVAGALQAAHEAGVVHRDLKPQNIFLCQRRNATGETLERVKVLDFGVSKVLGDQSSMTRTEAVLGTPWYMSPEQAEARSAEADQRSDVFALGAIAYHMLSGEPPFAGGSVPAVLYKVVHVDPPPLRGPGVAPSVAAAVAAALSKDPAQRPASAEAFVRLLHGTAADGATTEYRAPPPARGEDPTVSTDLPVVESPTASAELTAIAPRPRPPWRRLLPIVGAAALVVLAAVVAYVVSLPPEAPPGAEPPRVRAAALAADAGPAVAVAAEATTPLDAAVTSVDVDVQVSPVGVRPDAGAVSVATRAPSRLRRRTPPRRRPRRPPPKVRARPRQTGALRVASPAVVADVYLDGRRVGQTPLRLADVPAGPHRVTVSARGYHPSPRRVTVKPGAEARLVVVLKPN